MTAQNTRRTSTGVVLPLAVSTDIWQAAIEKSVVTQLAEQTPLPGGGVEIQVITGDPVAEFTAETEEKAVSDGTFGSKTMRGYTIAVIEPLSNQFKRDLPALYKALVNRLPGAIAKAFDAAALHGIGAPTGDFDTLAASPTQSLTPDSVYNDLLASFATVTAVDDADPSGFAISPAMEQLLLGELDANSRPLFGLAGDAPKGQIGTLLSRPVFKSKKVFDATTTPDTIGIVGDWSKARWGQVEAIQIKINTEGTINKGGTLLHLWQRNMFAVMCEVEMGFRVETDDAFVRLTKAA